MAKFNAKREPVVPTTVNKMGEKSYKLDPREEFVATVLTTFLQKSYYESESEITRRIITNLRKVDPLFAAKTAVYARDDANMRSVTHLIAGELASSMAGKEWGKRFYRKIAVRPDDMTEIISYYKNVKRKGKSLSLPNSMKKGFKAKLESMDAYLIDKYKMNGREFSLIDLVNLLHPATNQGNAEAYKRLMAGESLEGLYGSKILEKQMSKAGQGKTTAREKVQAKEEAITEVLSNVAGMPIMNLLRNLRNILLYAPNQVDEACRQLTIRNKVHKSRLLPFRFLTAYEEISKMTSGETSTATPITFESDRVNRTTAGQFVGLRAKVLTALEEAMKISCENIPKLDGKTAILIDHSGSMRGDDGGSSLVSAFSRTTSSMIANLFGTMVAMGQEDVYIGLFGNKLIAVDIDRSKGILWNAKGIHKVGGSVGAATEHGIYTFFNECVKGRVHVDNVIVFSDMVIGDRCGWYGTGSIDGYAVHGTGTFQKLFKDFRKVNPTCNVVSVDIRQTDGKSVFDKSLRVTQVAGWSNMIFEHMKAGTAGYKDIIKAIEAIEI